MNLGFREESERYISGRNIFARHIPPLPCAAHVTPPSPHHISHLAHAAAEASCKRSAQEKREECKQTQRPRCSAEARFDQSFGRAEQSAKQIDLKVALGFFTDLIRHEEGKHAVCEECKGEASSQGDHHAASAGGKFQACAVQGAILNEF
jgi:hypothetical protein